MQTLHHIILFSLAASASGAENALVDSVMVDSTVARREARLDVQEVRSNRSASPRPRRIIAREELGRASSLADLLSQEPGLLMQRAGGLGSIARISMRGSPSEQVEVWMDGQPLGGSAGSAVDLGPIPLDGLERVEIVQAGSDGASAAPRIELVSRQGWSRTGLSARAGSFGEKALSAWWSDKAGRIALSGWYESADNDYEVPWDNGTQYNTSDDHEIRLSNNDYTGRGASASLRPTSSLDFLLRADDSRRGVSIPGSDDEHGRLEGSSVLGRGRWRQDAWALHPAITLSARWFRSEWSDPKKSSGYDVDFGSEENGLDGTIAMRVGREESDWRDWWAGSDLRLERSDRTSTGKVEATVTPSGDRRTFGAEAGWRGQEPSSLFGAEASVRGERMLDGRDWSENLGTVSTGERVETDWSGARLAGRIWTRPVANWSLWLSCARRIRPPDFREWMGDNGFTLQTPDLEVERSTTGEAGFRASFGPVEGSLAGWIASYEDPIESYQRGASPLVSHRNAPGYLARGLDAEIALRLPFASFSAAGTAQEASIDDPNPTLDGNRPRRFPTWKTTLRASTAPLYGTVVGTDVELQGETYASELNRATDRRPGRALLGTWLRWTRRGFATTLSLRNLLDEHPEDYEDIPLAGRQYSLRIDFDIPNKSPDPGEHP